MAENDKKTLSGTHGYAIMDGVVLFECSGVEMKVTINRDDVQNGMSVDSIIVGLKGEGTLTINQFATRNFKDYLEAVKRGEDPRITLVSGIKSPTAHNKQQENIIARNVWFNEITLQKWQRGEKVTKDIPFGFTPSEAEYEDTIDYEG